MIPDSEPSDLNLEDEEIEEEKPDDQSGGFDNGQ